MSVLWGLLGPQMPLLPHSLVGDGHYQNDIWRLGVLLGTPQGSSTLEGFAAACGARLAQGLTRAEPAVTGFSDRPHG